jgi:hypothetical protein
MTHLSITKSLVVVGYRTLERRINSLVPVRCNTPCIATSPCLHLERRHGPFLHVKGSYDKRTLLILCERRLSRTCSTLVLTCRLSSPHKPAKLIATPLLQAKRCQFCVDPLEIPSFLNHLYYQSRRHSSACYQCPLQGNCSVASDSNRQPDNLL